VDGGAGLDVFATGTEGPARRRPPANGGPAADAPVPDEVALNPPGGGAPGGGTGVRQRVPIPEAMRGVEPRFLRQRAAEVLATRQEHLVPVRRILRRGDELWVLSDADGGVALGRLLERAKPSLAEAAALAAGVLEAVAAMHTAGQAHGGLDAQAVRIGPDGSARVAGWAANALVPAGRHEDVRRADAREAAGLVARIGKAAGRPIRPLTDREERIVARLRSAADARNLARRDLRKAAHGLVAAIGPLEQRRRAHEGVASLAAAVVSLDPPPGLPAGPAWLGTAWTGTAADEPLEVVDEIPEVLDEGPAAPDRPPVIVTDPAVPPARPGGDTVLSAGAAGPCAGRRAVRAPARHRIWPRVWKGAAVAAVVALILGVELRLFGDRVSRNVHVLLSGDLKGAAAAPGPRGPGPMPVLGPAAAGPVTHLELRPLDTCRPGAPCTAMVQVTVVAPKDAPLDVAYGLEVVDRCRPGRESRPGGVLSVPPGQDRAVQTVSLPLPEGRALAVIPISTSPVTVAGTPLRLPGDDGPC